MDSTWTSFKGHGIHFHKCGATVLTLAKEVVRKTDMTCDKIDRYYKCNEISLMHFSCFLELVYRVFSLIPFKLVVRWKLVRFWVHWNLKLSASLKKSSNLCNWHYLLQMRLQTTIRRQPRAADTGCSSFWFLFILIYYNVYTQMASFIANGILNSWQ